MPTFVHALRTVAAAALIAIASTATVFAQQQPPPMPKQVALSDAQIQKMFAAKTDLDAIDAKYANEKPEVAETKAMAEAEVALKKHGFAGGLAEFDNIAFSIGVVLGALDENNNLLTKEQIIARAKKQIETSSLPAPEKSKALAEVDQSAGEIVPPLPANVEIVKKQAAKLRELMQ